MKQMVFQDLLSNPQNGIIIRGGSRPWSPKENPPMCLSMVQALLRDGFKIWMRK